MAGIRTNAWESETTRLHTHAHTHIHTWQGLKQKDPLLEERVAALE